MSGEKVETDTQAEEFEGTVSPLQVVLALLAVRSFRLSIAPFSVFLTFMLVLVELPSNTMSGRFRRLSTGAVLNKEMVTQKQY